MTKKPRKKRWIPNDELVTYGFIHMERMDDDHVWFDLDGYRLDLIVKKGKIEIIPQEPELLEPLRAKKPRWRR